MICYTFLLSFLSYKIITIIIMNQKGYVHCDIWSTIRWTQEQEGHFPLQLLFPSATCTHVLSLSLSSRWLVLGHNPNRRSVCQPSTTRQHVCRRHASLLRIAHSSAISDSRIARDEPRVEGAHFQHTWLSIRVTNAVEFCQSAQIVWDIFGYNLYVAHL